MAETFFEKTNEEEFDMTSFKGQVFPLMRQINDACRKLEYSLFMAVEFTPDKVAEQLQHQEHTLVQTASVRQEGCTWAALLCAMLYDPKYKDELVQVMAPIASAILQGQKVAVNVNLPAEGNISPHDTLLGEDTLCDPNMIHPDILVMSGSKKAKDQKKIDDESKNDNNKEEALYKPGMDFFQE